MNEPHELRKSDWLDDWYVVDGTPFGQPEGTATEWRQIIDLMRQKQSGAPARRVGVVMCDDGSAQVYSPRNAVSDDDFAEIRNVNEWINAAEKLLSETAATAPVPTTKEATA